MYGGFRERLGGTMNRPGIAGDQILWEDRSWAMELGLHKS